MTTEITTAQEWNTFPNGTVFTDADGWKHRKVSDAVLNPESGENTVNTSRYTDNDGHEGDFGSPWMYGPLTTDAVPSVTEPPAHPLIDFSGSSRATAREYAAALNSRVLNPDNQAVLKQAARGGKVDVYRLNAAVTEGLSSCATRAGQSMARREMTKKGRYLGHIVQAVLENHADNLPAYPEGERSRVAFEARARIDNAERIAREQAAKINEQSTLLDKAADALRAAKHEVDSLLTIGEARDHIITDVTADLAIAQQKLSVALAERDAAAAVISYVTERLSEEERQRVFGYWDGVKDATLPSSEG